VLKNFVIANITETDSAQIILGRSFLATSRCATDVKQGQIIFEVWVLCNILF